MIRYWIFPASVGDACLVAGEQGVKRLILPGLSKGKMVRQVMELFPQAVPGPKSIPPEIREAVWFVRGFFKGGHQKDCPVPDLSYLPGFQRKVLEITRTISPGQTRSYSWVAERAGKPKAARAVAQALARNPVPLFVPCHRVIGKDGSLRGFSAPGGIRLKKLLLDRERGAREKNGV